jgi:hypothetical protein
LLLNAASAGRVMMTANCTLEPFEEVLAGEHDEENEAEGEEVGARVDGADSELLRRHPPKGSDEHPRAGHQRVGAVELGRELGSVFGPLQATPATPKSSTFDAKRVTMMLSGEVSVRCPSRAPPTAPHHRDEELDGEAGHRLPVSKHLLRPPARNSSTMKGCLWCCPTS